MRKGISLITLVITIIIMIIIAGAVIVSLSNSSIFDQATKTIFVSDIKTLLEEYNIYAAFYMADGNDIHELNVPVGSVKDVVKALPDDSIYAEKIAIVNGKLTYMVNVKDKADVERANWACEAGMNVNGFTGCSDIEYVEPDYRMQGTIYYNIPDLTGFNKDTTFYVTYNGDTEIIGESISKKAPANWYDYDNKEWANIVAIKDNMKAYFVWIPRYAYKVIGANSSDQADKKIDVRFVDNDNVYIDENGDKHTYSDTVPTFDETTGEQSNYVIHPAFDVNMGTEENPEIKHLSGFWMSKYEVSETFTNVSTVLGTNYIEITGITPVAAKFDYYLDGALKQADEDATYKYEGLEHDKTYTVKIVAKDSNGKETGTYIKEYTTLGENTNGITMFPADTYGDNIVIYSTTLTDLANQNNVKIYEFYLDDELKHSNDTGKYTIEGLTAETTYKVTVKIKDTGVHYGEYTRTLTTPGVPTYNTANAPDLTGFNPENTFYVTYDENGKEEIGVSISNPAPEGWYDYDNKEWANIVVINEEVGGRAYFTWIPRYEYRVLTGSSNSSEHWIDIAFIPETKLEPTVGYILHPSFDINMGTEEDPDIKHLPGFWMSKYEVSETETVTE